MPVLTHPLIMLFAKAPRPGFVKTRLAARVGDDEAVRLYRLLVERQLRDVPVDWPLEIHFAPGDAEPEMRAWLGRQREYVAQSSGDLGERLQRAFARGFDRGSREVIAIGGDCPELGMDDFLRASEFLNTHDAVIGPARDGGYYLIGLRRPAPQLFEDVPWSTSHVLAATLRRIQNSGLSCALLEEKEDIDDLDAVQRIHVSVCRRMDA